MKSHTRKKYILTAYLLLALGIGMPGQANCDNSSLRPIREKEIAVDAVEELSGVFEDPELHAYRLRSGAQLWTRLSKEGIRSLRRHGTGLVYEDKDRCLKVRCPIPPREDWPIKCRGLYEAGEELGASISGIHMAQIWREKDEGRQTIKLEWGCGYGYGSRRLHGDFMWRKRVVPRLKAKFAGYANAYYRELEKVPADTIFTLDVYTALHRYFKPGEIGSVWSCCGLSYLDEMHLRDHLIGLRPLIAEGGFVLADINHRYVKDLPGYEVKAWPKCVILKATTPGDFVGAATPDNSRILSESS